MLTFYHVFTGDQYCSNNIVTSFTDLVQAIWDDVETIVALLGRCFGGVRSRTREPTAHPYDSVSPPCAQHGLAGCICQFAVRARARL